MSTWVPECASKPSRAQHVRPLTISLTCKYSSRQIGTNPSDRNAWEWDVRKWLSKTVQCNINLTLSHTICMRECKSVCKFHLKVLKFARAKIESTSAIQGLSAKAHDILKNYVSKVPRILYGSHVHQQFQTDFVSGFMSGHVRPSHCSLNKRLEN